LKIPFCAAIVAIALSGQVSRAEQIAPPVGFLKTRSLSSDVTMSPATAKVYFQIIDTLEKEPLVKVYEESLKDANFPIYQTVNLAWRGDGMSSEALDKMTIQRGTLMFDIIKHLAKRRKETVLCLSNDVLVISHPYQSADRNIEEDTIPSWMKRKEGDLPGILRFPIRPGAIRLERVDGDLVQTFLNIKFKEDALSYDETGHEKNTGPYILKMNKKVKAKIVDFNLYGMWSYSEFLDALCLLYGLKWELNGNTVWLEDRLDEK